MNIKTQQNAKRKTQRKLKAAEQAIEKKNSVVLPIVEALAIRAREVEPPTEKGRQDESVDDSVRYD